MALGRRPLGIQRAMELCSQRCLLGCAGQPLGVGRCGRVPLKPGGVQTHPQSGGGGWQPWYRGPQWGLRALQFQLLALPFLWGMLKLGTPALNGRSFSPQFSKYWEPVPPTPLPAGAAAAAVCRVGSGHCCGLAADVSFCFCQLQLRIQELIWGKRTNKQTNVCGLALLRGHHTAPCFTP